MTNELLEILEHIDAEKRLMNSLLQLLDVELTALTSNKLLDLSENTTKKNHLLVQISESEQQRHSLLKNLGYLPDFTPISSTINAFPMTVELQRSWDDLVSTSQNAKKSNQNNGVLINRLITKNQEALHILTNVSNTNANMYGPSGQTTNGNSSSRNVIVG